MKLIINRQDALALFHMTEDSGKWFAVACAGGVMRAVGRKIEKDEEIAIKFDPIEICPKCLELDTAGCDHKFHDMGAAARRAIHENEK